MCTRLVPTDTTTVDTAFEVLRKRIDKFGVTQPNIQRLGNSGRILVELPGAKDVERIRKLLQSTAQLEFWDVYPGNQFLQFIGQADQVLKDIVQVEDEAEEVESQDEEDATEDKIEKVRSRLKTVPYIHGHLLFSDAGNDRQRDWAGDSCTSFYHSGLDC